MIRDKMKLVLDGKAATNWSAFADYIEEAAE